MGALRGGQKRCQISDTLVVVLVVGGLIAACSSDTNIIDGLQSGSPEKTEQEAEAAEADPGQMMPRLRASYIASVQENAGDEYRFDRHDGRATASNPVVATSPSFAYPQSCRPSVLVMKTTQHRESDDPSVARAGRFRGNRCDRYLLADPLMRTPGVEVGDILLEHAEHLALADDDDVIQTLPTNTAQEALAGGIRLGRTNRCA